MKKSRRNFLVIITLSLNVFVHASLQAQTITGAWKGRIKNTRVELKLVRVGDSLAGTSYYYESKNEFRRYSIKGYFDPLTNEAVWWDDQLVSDKSPGLFVKGRGSDALMSTADFNCPGEDKMMLDGTASLRDNPETVKGKVHLEKTDIPLFPDEWDFVIENYTQGANDPTLIDSVAQIPFSTAYKPEEVIPEKEEVAIRQTTQPKIIEGPKPMVVVEKKLPEAPAQTIEQKFGSRKKTLTTTIPITGDSIELRFYDNAEIDGDSIALFLNNQLVFKNIRLSDQPYIVKFASSSLENENDLVMVAENLGSIPPNTSLMIAIVADKRYEARLQSSENSSALIRFVRETKVE